MSEPISPNGSVEREDGDARTPRQRFFDSLPKSGYKIAKISDPEGSRRLIERIRKNSEYTEKDRLRF